jgi:tetratricopeptide (TPR) repeat protein
MRLAGALESLGRTGEAIGEQEEVVRLTRGDVIGLAGLAKAYARAGRLPQARTLLRQLLDESRRRYVAPAAVAEIYEQLGDVDAAFEWLEKAYSEHSNKIAYLGVEPHPRLRADPRYASLLRRAGLE